MLAQAGADIYITNLKRINLLHLAVYKNNKEIVEMLIKSGFPLDLVTEKGMSALYIAASLNHMEVAELILCFLKES